MFKLRHRQQDHAPLLSLAFADKLLPFFIAGDAEHGFWGCHGHSLLLKERWFPATSSRSSTDPPWEYLTELLHQTYSQVHASALFVVPGSPPDASKRLLFWSYSRSSGRFPSGRSHYPRRHVQVQAEHAKSLQNDVRSGILVSVPAIATVGIRTDKHAISKGEIFFARPTTVAQLAGSACLFRNFFIVYV